MVRIHYGVGSAAVGSFLFTQEFSEEGSSARCFPFALALVTTFALWTGGSLAQEAGKKQRPEKVAKQAQPQIPVLEQWLKGLTLSGGGKAEDRGYPERVCPHCLSSCSSGIGRFSPRNSGRSVRKSPPRAKAEGKSQEEIAKLQAEGVELKPEQKEALAKLQAERRELQQKLAKAVLEVLSPANKEEVQARVAKLLKLGKPAGQPPREKKKKRAKE